MLFWREEEGENTESRGERTGQRKDAPFGSVKGVPFFKLQLKIMLQCPSFLSQCLHLSEKRALMRKTKGNLMSGGIAQKHDRAHKHSLAQHLAYMRLTRSYA